MTDTRLPEWWLTDRRILRLTPSAFRTLVLSYVWSVSNRTDGVVELDDFDLIPQAGRDDLAELVRRDLVQRSGDRLVLGDWARTQTSRHELEVLDNARRREREKKARQREKKATDTEPGPRDSPEGTSRGTVPRDSTGRKEGQEGQDSSYGTVDKKDDDRGPSLAEWDGVTRCTTSGHEGFRLARRDCRNCDMSASASA